MKHWKKVGNWEIAFTMTNWTFGFYWGWLQRSQRWCWGIDIGPLEICWSKKRKAKK